MARLVEPAGDRADQPVSRRDGRAGCEPGDRIHPCRGRQPVVGRGAGRAGVQGADRGGPGRPGLRLAHPRRTCRRAGARGQGAAMSGSPKYTTLTVSQERLQREAEARARRAAQRRERQEARVARLRALEEERARQRLAREAEQLSKVLQDSRRAVGEQVEAVGVMVADVRREVPDAGAAAIADQIRTLQADLADLDSKIRTGSDLPGYQRAAESLRTRALALRAGAPSAAGRAGRPQVLADLGKPLAALDAGAVTPDARQRARCDELVARLASAATEIEGIRFEALHGTTEHAVASLERKAADLLGRQQVAATGADRARAAQAAVAAQDRLDEAAARLAVIAAAAQEAASDAAAFAEHELSGQLEGALAAAVAAVSAGPAGRQAEAGQPAVRRAAAGQSEVRQAEAAGAEAAGARLGRLLTEAG